MLHSQTGQTLRIWNKSSWQIDNLSQLMCNENVLIYSGLHFAFPILQLIMIKIELTNYLYIIHYQLQFSFSFRSLSYNWRFRRLITLCLWNSSDMTFDVFLSMFTFALFWSYNLISWWNDRTMDGGHNLCRWREKFLILSSSLCVVYSFPAALLASPSLVNNEIEFLWELGAICLIYSS